MTTIQKLSDRDSIIFDAIQLILVNMGNMDKKQLQWELFCRGIFIKPNLLHQALVVMKEKGQIIKPNVEPTKEPIQEEKSEA